MCLPDAGQVSKLRGPSDYCGASQLLGSSFPTEIKISLITYITLPECFKNEIDSIYMTLYIHVHEKKEQSVTIFSEKLTAMGVHPRQVLQQLSYQGSSAG